ncbi:MAG: hypothetical protein M0032_05240, partial [Actinomycetota bacterium]|nr:hypothetical protein [Actinomycetota bacterium]
QVRNELVIEVFYPADRDFFAMVRRSTSRWSMQVTIESPDPAIRKVNGKFPVPNDVVEATLAAALDEGCEKLDLFFMIGLSGQTPAIALQTVDYCAHLVERFGADRRLQFYAAPLGPFLDPGSRAFEDPSLGYHRRFSTLEEHRQALLGPTWREMLAYETDWMTRDQIVEATYAVGAGLNDLKLEAGLIDAATHDTVARHFAIAIETFPKVDAIARLPEPERHRALLKLAAQVEEANTASLVGEHELEWKTAAGLRVSRVLARHTAAALPRELSHGLARLAGRYDTAVAHVRRLPTCATLPVGTTCHLDGDGDDPAARRGKDLDHQAVAVAISRATRAAGERAGRSEEGSHDG